jgi:hypothetical protein
MSLSVAYLRHAFAIVVLTRTIFVWVVFDHYRKFFGGAKQRKRIEGRFWSSAVFDQTTPWKSENGAGVILAEQNSRIVKGAKGDRIEYLVGDPRSTTHL